jgi:hypothetical protein
MPPLQDAIIRVLPPLRTALFAPGLAPCPTVDPRSLAELSPRTAPASLRRIGRTTKHHFTHDRQIRNRAIWSARHGGQTLSGLLITLLIAPGAYGRGGGRWRRGTALRAEDYGKWPLPGDGALSENACRSLCRPEMGVNDAMGSGTVTVARLHWEAARYHPQPTARRLARSQTLEGNAPVKLAVLSELL